MRLKYYLRGLGIGILVTCLIFMISNKSRVKEVTDDEIRTRAKELGMVEQTLANGPIGNGVFDETEIETEIEIETETETEIETEMETNTETESQIQEEIASTVYITVKSGDSSYTVCKEMEKAGLIEDAKAFDQFLSKNGYDRRISVGRHELIVGSSLEEMGKALTH